MNTPLLLLVAALATYRATRLVTADQITVAIRAWAERRGPFLGYLSTCDWCLSIWVAPAPAVAAIVWGDNRAVQVVLLWLALSAVTGLLSLVERNLDN